MTARVSRQAVLVLTWLIVTTSATAMAWWAVTFVTAVVADRLPLRPSDVVAATARQAVPVPSSVYGTQTIAGPPPPAPEPPVDVVSADSGVSPALATTGGNAAGPVAAPAALAGVAARRASDVGPRLVGQGSSTPTTGRVAAAGVTAPVSTPAPVSPPPAAPAVAVPPPREFALARTSRVASGAVKAVAAASGAPAPVPEAPVPPPREYALGRRSRLETGTVKPVAAAPSAPAPVSPAVPVAAAASTPVPVSPAAPAAAVGPAREFALTRKSTLVTAAAVTPASSPARSDHHVAATSPITRPSKLADRCQHGAAEAAG